jgi:K+-transporting ATPase ATPase C chain
MKHIRTAALMLLVLTLLTGVLYPLVVTAAAQLAFPAQANGSLIVRNGSPVGSSLIGQPFADAKHFWSRASATSPVGYNGTASSGSNLGPTDPALFEAVTGRVDALVAADPEHRKPIPVDLVTSSASGPILT